MDTISMSSSNSVINFVNHTEDLVNFFEGSEKLLEIWFKPPVLQDNANNPSFGKKDGLRRISKEKWSDLLTHVRCTIVSTTCNEEIDAYLLSESSLFVTSYRLLIKTCGTTTLLEVVPLVLELAKEECGLDEVLDLFYSRKNFMEPTKQHFPHQSFDDEVQFLDRFFDGSAYVLGAINGDHWYLYTLNKEDMLIEHPDQTLEILMSDLDPEAMKAFYKDDEFISDQHSTQVTGIADLMPGANLDPLMFDPCGYSINAIKDENYFTIHVTPQSHCSFASFETNIESQDINAKGKKTYGKLINQVLKIFKPRKFIITFFRNKLSNSRFVDEEIKGYKRQDSINYQFHQYSLSFGHFRLA